MRKKRLCVVGMLWLASGMMVMSGCGQKGKSPAETVEKSPAATTDGKAATPAGATATAGGPAGAAATKGNAAGDGIDRSSPQALFAEFSKVLMDDSRNPIAYARLSTLASQKEMFASFLGDVADDLKQKPDQEARLKAAFEKRNVPYEPISKMLAMKPDERKQSMLLITNPLPQLEALWDFMSSDIKELKASDLKPSFPPTLHDIKIEGDVATASVTLEDVSVKVSGTTKFTDEKTNPPDFDTRGTKLETKTSPPSPNTKGEKNGGGGRITKEKFPEGKVERTVIRNKQTKPLIFKQIDGKWYVDLLATERRSSDD